jgi:hypothetical protein
MDVLRVRGLAFLIAFAVSIAAGFRLHADVIVLKDGKVIEGTVQDKADAYEVVTKYGTLTIRKEEVARVVRDAAALKAEAETLRGVAASLAEEAQKGGVSAEERGRKLSAAEEALRKALALYQDARSVSSADAATAMDLVMADLNRELARIREKRGAEAPPTPTVLDVPPPPPTLHPAVQPARPQPLKAPPLALLKPGLQAEFFKGRDFQVRAASRVDPNIHFDWNLGPAWSGGPVDNFSARWTGYLNVTKPARYTFEVFVDDGAELLIDGMMIVSSWRSQAAAKYAGTVPLDRGLHHFELSYFEDTSTAKLQLSWKEEISPFQVIEPRYFFHVPAGVALPMAAALGPQPPTLPGRPAGSLPPASLGLASLAPGLQAEYFTGRDLTARAVSRIDPNIDFDWQTGAAWAGGPADNFSARWTGYLYVPRSGRYTFEAFVDDGVELSIDGAKIISSWRSQAPAKYTGTSTLQEGYHRFEMIYFEDTSTAMIRLSWKEGDGAFQIISPRYYYHSPSGAVPPRGAVLDASRGLPAERPAGPLPSREARGPEPAAEAQKAAETLIRQTFKSDYAKRAPNDQKALARRLLRAAEETTNDPAARYVLLREGRDLAAAAGDPDTALAAVDWLAAGYAVNAHTLKAAVVEAASRSARTPESAAALARGALAAAEEAVAADAFEDAAALAQRAAAIAPLARDPVLLEFAQARAREIADFRGEFARVRDAVKKLAESPDDPDANQAVGRFRCVVKRAWEDGLPLLARGSDPALKEAAAKDLGNPADAPACMEAGDRWWALAEKEAGSSVKNALRARAGYWYAKALPNLAGLSRLKVQDRLNKISEATTRPPLPKPRS